MYKIFAAVLLCSFLQQHAHADYFYSGDHLVELVAEYQKAMRSDIDTKYENAWAYRAYVIGVFDTANGILFCPPGGLGEKQVSSIVAQFLENHPEQWNKSGSSIVVSAMTQLYPCSK